MSISTRHFVLSDEGIREVSALQATQVAAGLETLPEFAEREVRYLQLVLDDGKDNELRVQATGTSIIFDQHGRLSGSSQATDQEAPISKFEYDACLQWALREHLPQQAATFH